MFSQLFRRKLMPMSLVLLVVLVAGCGDDDDGDNGMIPMPEVPAIRVVHSSPDAPAVDVYAAGSSTPLFTNVAYGEATNYLTVDAGTVKIQLRPAGADPGSTPVFETGDLTIGADDRITAVAAGLIAATGAADAFRILPLVEGFADPGTSVRARIVHAGADAPSVAVDVGNDGTPEITDFARFADTGATGVELPSGEALAIGIWAGSPLARVTAFTTPALPAGAEIFVIATGLLSQPPRDDDGFALLAVGPEGAIGLIKQNPVVYALHASPDAPAVDIAVGGTSTILVSNLAFGDLSDPVQVAPAAYTLDFRATGTSNVAASLTTPSLAAGERYLAIATGFLSPESGEPSFQLFPLADGFDRELATPLLRVAHASPDAPAVDVGTVSGNVLTPLAPFTDLAFAESSVEEGAEVPAAALLIGVAPTGMTTPVATFNVTTSVGLRAIAVAAGALSPEVGIDEPFRLLLINTAVWPWTVATVNPN
jgi:hypothetical protein